jgi:RNA ligase
MAGFFNQDQIAKLNSLIDEGYVRFQSHPTEDLYIYNYTDVCQFDRIWNDVTLYTRGLILNVNYELISRPFKKFFNLSELESEYVPDVEMTNEYLIQDKMDGFMGICYIDSYGYPWIASRGSFTSEQAQKANQILYQKYTIDEREKLKQNSQEYTYIFEIIYPKQQHNVGLVVDYNDIEDLYLIAIIDKQTGEDLMLNHVKNKPVQMELLYIGFPRVEEFNINHDTLSELTQLNWNNAEGLVIKFNTDEYVKIKFEEYVRKFNIINTFTYKKIIDEVIYGDIQSIYTLLDDIDQFNRAFIEDKIKEIENKYNTIKTQVLEDAVNLHKEINQQIQRNNREDTKKTFAEYLFNKIDHYDYKQIIKMIAFKLKDGTTLQNSSMNHRINSMIRNLIREQCK